MLNFSLGNAIVKALGLDIARGPVILGMADIGATNRQTDRKVGAQSEGPRSPEVAWLPKPNMLIRGVRERIRPVSTHHRRDRGVRWSVGPGLLLALALLAPAGRAENAAGLDAQGVDPRTALNNRWGLDVRDELGRPVSSEKVLAEMKGVAIARAATNAFASRLPKARVLLPAIELLAKAAAAFRMAAAGIPIAEILPGLPGGRPKVAVLWLVALMAATLTASCCCRSKTELVLSRSRQSCPEVLRC